MIDFKKYFIVGTNSEGLQDTMNGLVIGELIRCKECLWYYVGGAKCMYWDGDNNMSGDDFCSQATRRDDEVRNSD